MLASWCRHRNWRRRLWSRRHPSPPSPLASQCKLALAKITCQLPPSPSLANLASNLKLASEKSITNCVVDIYIATINSGKFATHLKLIMAKKSFTNCRQYYCRPSHANIRKKNNCTLPTISLYICSPISFVLFHLWWSFFRWRANYLLFFFLHSLSLW